MSPKHLIITIIVLLFCFCSFAKSSPLNEDFYISDDKTFKDILLQNKQSLEDWTTSINNTSDFLYCLGETHFDSFRDFLATKLLPQLSIDKLYLEETSSNVLKILQKHKESNEITITGANISGILDTVLGKNPNIEIIGVDESGEQEKAARLFELQTKRKFLSRDGFIAQNILESLRPGLSHFALYGSSHCSKNGYELGGIITFLRHLIDMEKKVVTNIKSVLIVQDFKGDFLANYFWSLGINTETFVIPDTSKIPERSYNYNWKLKNYFNNYDVIIFFK